MADGTIDSLSIEIGASSAKAVRNINNIAVALGGLKTAVSGVNLGNVKRELGKLGNTEYAKIEKLAEALSKLKGISLNANIGTNMMKIADACDLIEQQHIDKLTKFGQAMQTLKSVSTRGYDKLPAAILNIASAVDSITDESIARIFRLTYALSRLKGVDLSGLGNVLRAQNDAWKISQKIQQGANKSGQTSQSAQTRTGKADGAGRTSIFSKESWKEAYKGAKKFSDTVVKVVSTAVRELKKVLAIIGNIGKQFASVLMRFSGISSITKAFSGLKNIFNSLGRIAFYRVIRSAIKAVTEAFSEGAERAYYYSKEFGDATRYISEAMDGLSSGSFKMSNQLGAAWDTMLATIQPILIEIINLVTKAAEAVTRFFAILGGKSTYLKAKDYTKDWAEYTEDGAKAAKEWRNQLMAFDEINRLEAPNDNDSNRDKDKYKDYGNMFEEVPTGSDYLKSLKDAFKSGDWFELGKLLADKVNALVDSVDWNALGAKIGEKIDGLVKTAYSFLKNVDFKKIGQSIGEFVKGLVDNIDFEYVGRLLIRKITALLDTIIGFIMTPGIWDSLAKAVGDFFHGAFLEASEWLSENNLADVIRTLGEGLLKVLQRVRDEIKEHKDVFIQIGQQIGNALAAIPWIDILKTIADILWTVFKSLIIDGLLSTEGGKIFAALFLAVKGLKLAFTLAAPVVEAGIEILAKAIAAKLLGIPAAATATATAAGTAAGGIGASIAGALTKAVPVVATAALAVTDAVMVAYDVKELNKASKTYKAAMDAHAHEAYSALNNYAKLYHEKGKEVADTWAKMVYDIDTSGMDFAEAQKAITGKISEYWEDTPQNMAQGFKQGVKYYFGGGGGGGVIGLLNDAGNGIINAFKNVLGIHSPSTVFADIGENIVEGLKDGLSNAWNSFASAVQQLIGNIVSNISESIGSAISNAWDNITNLVSSARSTLSSIASGISNTVSNVVSTVKNVVKVKKYANGGYPTEGQLFYARENGAGPELVGTVGGRTAVASNNDILSGITQGVYEAFSAALRQSDSLGGDDREIAIYMDGKEIARTTTRYQRQFARAAG